MRGKWTEGEWKVQHGGHLMPDHQRLIVADLGRTKSGFREIRTIGKVWDNAGPEESVANAYLIAASPGLYEALEWLLASVEADPAKENHPGDREERLTLACGAAQAALSLAHPQPKGEEA